MLAHLQVGVLRQRLLQSRSGQIAECYQLLLSLFADCELIAVRLGRVQ